MEEKQRVREQREACIDVWHEVHSSKGYLKEVVVGRETHSLWEHFAEQVRGVVVPLTPGSSWSPAALGPLHATCRSSCPRPRGATRVYGAGRTGSQRP